MLKILLTFGLNLKVYLNCNFVYEWVVLSLVGGLDAAGYLYVGLYDSIKYLICIHFWCW